MTTHITFRAAKDEEDGKAILYMLVGSTHRELFGKLTLGYIHPEIAHFLFFHLFEHAQGEGNAVSNAHNHVVELTIKEEILDPDRKVRLTPVSTKLDISLNDYRRLRRATERRDSIPGFIDVGD